MHLPKQFRLPAWSQAWLLVLVAFLLTPQPKAVYGAGAGLPSRQLHFERINEQQGLSSKTLTCGLQDHYGFLWFGSEDGLIRYDGYTFKEYIFNPTDPHSLASNLVYALTEDSQGNLWVGTVGGGLNRYDRSNDSFIRYQHEPDNPQSLSHNGVISLLEDSSGNLWIGTEGGGLNRLGPDRKTFVRYTNDPDNEKSLANNTIWHLYEDSKHRLWVGTFGGGLDLYQPNTDSFTHFRHQESNPDSLASNSIGAIFEDSTGRLWVGSINGGLCRFDPETGRAIHYQYNPDGGISHNHIWGIHEDESGLLWLTSFGGGLMLFDPATGKASTYRHNPTVANSLSSDFVWFMMESQDDIIWIGTDGEGLNKLVKRARHFNHLLTDTTQPFSLSYNGITGAAEGKNGLLWLANDGGGFQRLDLAGNSSRLFRHEPDNPNSLVSDLAEVILVDRLGTVWVGTYNGLSAYNPHTGIFKTYLHTPDSPDSLSDNRIWSLMEDSEGNLWVGTRSGLNRLSPDRNTITRLAHRDDQPESLSDNGIWTIFEDSHHTIWIGTDNGLNRMWQNGQGFDHFFSVQNDPHSLSHNNITAIHEDRRGNLWVGTTGGLNKLAHSGKGFSRFTVENGLISNSIRSIMEDDRSFLWITTVKGLTRFNPESNTFENFDRNDGLQGSEFSRAHCRTKSGEMLIGGRDGINIFKPEKIVRNSHVPPVYLTTIEKQDGSIVHPNLGAPRPINLNYTDNTVTFEFTALDYSNPQHNSYAYLLEGFDRDWISAGNRRTATYTNLDGGNYLFRVKGSNNHNLWNNEGSSIALVVAAPPWQRWWAYCLYLLLAAGIFSSLVTLKASQHRKRLAAVQQINEELQHEISDRQKAEQALHESEKRLSMALEASRLGIWEFYPQEGTTYYSDTWFTMLGYAPGEFPHNYQTWAELLHPDDLEPNESFIRQLLADKGDSFNLEFRMRAKDGRYRWIQGVGKTFSRDAENKITHMCGVHLDITEKKEWLNMIEASERRYRELFDEAPIMYVILEDRDGKAWIRDANNTFVSTLGYGREEVLNTLLSNYYAPVSRSLILARKNYNQIVNRTFQPEERQLLTRDGRTIDCLLHASPEMAEDGTVSAIRAMFLDISHKKHAEAERNRLESALYQAQKMEAIGTLAGGIAHDFNNILAAIIGYCDLLLLEMKEDSPFFSKVKQISLAGARARDLVQQILTFSRRNERKLEPMQIAPVVEEALKLLRSTLPASISINAKISENLPNITADPTQVHQIIMNLCTNSAQAMPDGGDINVALDALVLEENDRRLLPHLQPGHYIRLTIADTGEGIPTEHLANIFTPYFTTKDKAKGTGLGLAVVHGIIQSYQGAIEVQSPANKGTIITVLIPSTEAEQLPQPALVTSVRAGSREHILFVDDEPMLVDIYRQILSALDYQVTAITSSRKALALFSNNPDQFDMLISDMTMPELTGDRLARQAKSLRPDLPVILLTGFSEKLQEQTSEDLAVEGLLFKPVDKGELAATIRTILENRKPKVP
ncbi:two-component regulator propeller domain-containing protein [Desulfopila aestuarii]|uniref:histidine kinase n=1 Tax=Desulfopila aestuarii DSM 18488 TaxID=1121416 RepID=A0A1M7YB87_9BACT|nr:two-component regulator propeller domain-containing protein [Desulfopila aestuarii]SHO49920.1 PAS domain S-box-containing protein [Desulfopila aestuarii DSM 18488]